jgi:hypothetical protein
METLQRKFLAFLNKRKRSTHFLNLMSCSSNITRVRMLPCVKVNNCEKWVENTWEKVLMQKKNNRKYFLSFTPANKTFLCVSNRPIEVIFYCSTFLD